LGVVVSFVVLASIIIGVKIGGQNIGWGYQMQSPLFVALLTILLFFVGLNLSGYFEIPLMFANLGGKISSEDNFIGSFLTGVLAVLVATPCTAPFMATAVGFALTQGSAVIITIFVALGLGLALPFMLISLFPSLIKLLPKSGGWLLTFKQLLAFPLYLSAVWLFWVLLREAGEDYATITLIAIVLISFAIWLLQRVGKLAKIFGYLIIIITIALLAILFSLPKTQTIEHTKFSVAEIDKLRKENKAIFVDATADWCITCKINENLVLSTSEIKNDFAEKHITYMVADWTHGDEEITKYLQSLKRSGVPIYVYYPANSGEPIILPQVLTKDIVLQTISK
ncbi:MAG: thioredoxin family protein, partial [Pseudomonadota bacterium]